MRGKAIASKAVKKQLRHGTGERAIKQKKFHLHYNKDGEEMREIDNINETGMRFQIRENDVLELSGERKLSIRALKVLIEVLSEIYYSKKQMG